MVTTTTTVTTAENWGIRASATTAVTATTGAKATATNATTVMTAAAATTRATKTTAATSTTAATAITAASATNCGDSDNRGDKWRQRLVVIVVTVEKIIQTISRKQAFRSVLKFCCVFSACELSAFVCSSQPLRVWIVVPWVPVTNEIRNSLTPITQIVA